MTPERLRAIVGDWLTLFFGLGGLAYQAIHPEKFNLPLAVMFFALTGYPGGRKLVAKILPSGGSTNGPSVSPASPESSLDSGLSTKEVDS